MMWTSGLVVKWIIKWRLHWHVLQLPITILLNWTGRLLKLAQRFASRFPFSVAWRAMRSPKNMTFAYIFLVADFHRTCTLCTPLIM